jgi:hypothetical protein
MWPVEGAWLAPQGANYDRAGAATPPEVAWDRLGGAGSVARAAREITKRAGFP